MFVYLHINTVVMVFKSIAWKGTVDEAIWKTYCFSVLAVSTGPTATTSCPF